MAAAKSAAAQKTCMPVTYFAYGSNLLTARLRARCPSATVIGVGAVAGYALAFTKRGADGSGKATLIAAGSGEVRTPGILFRIDDADLARLDAIEGAGYARRDDLEIKFTDGSRSIEAVSYEAIDNAPDLRPFDWYLALAVAGALEHGLAAAHIARLRRTPFVVDRDVERARRREAIAVLQAHGHADYRALLRATRGGD
jgi:gamma-glutamylcyclotransferase (GGCT)/AIG2-like uncharacterized protein YtfP